MTPLPVPFRQGRLAYREADRAIGPRHRGQMPPA